MHDFIEKRKEYSKLIKEVYVPVIKVNNNNVNFNKNNNNNNNVNTIH
jgi:hypothetical protein